MKPKKPRSERFGHLNDIHFDMSVKADPGEFYVSIDFNGVSDAAWAPASLCDMIEMRNWLDKAIAYKEAQDEKG